MTVGNPPASPRTEEPGVLSRVATEAACEGCGYNLRMQGVRRDAQTGILVVRCPECGQFSAAETLRPPVAWWKPRLACLLLSLQAMLTLGLGFALLGVNIAFIEETRGSLLILLSRLANDEDIWAMLIGGVPALLLTAALIQRLPLLARAVVLCMPVVAAGALYIGQRGSWVPRDLTGEALGGCAMLFLPALLTAIFIRPILRALVRALCPQPFRRTFDYLWQIDGKLPPLTGAG